MFVAGRDKLTDRPGSIPRRLPRTETPRIEVPELGQYISLEDADLEEGDVELRFCDTVVLWNGFFRAFMSFV